MAASPTTPPTESRQPPTAILNLPNSVSGLLVDPAVEMEGCPTPPAAPPRVMSLPIWGTRDDPIVIVLRLSEAEERVTTEGPRVTTEGPRSVDERPNRPYAVASSSSIGQEDLLSQAERGDEAATSLCCR